MGRSLRGRWREHHRTANSLLASIPQPQLLCRPCSLPPPQPALPPLPPPNTTKPPRHFTRSSPRRFFPPCAHAVLAALAAQPAAPRVLCPVSLHRPPTYYLPTSHAPRPPDAPGGDCDAGREGNCIAAVVHRRERGGDLWGLHRDWSSARVAPNSSSPDRHWPDVESPQPSDLRRGANVTSSTTWR
ncbi:hypothetical protein BS50DRAFT_62226 [Corynespora cassiicola Philippines]|uniref:Uncharacterized protein n=1 Tax=Corynespora cassiicola Philippines TaxID=1448308 RepID=A0A2T2NJP6_CORCC|nr:hypothetical protein BS50DRAFT_62226 [Corynespora cassiicola Philippines]